MNSKRMTLRDESLAEDKELGIEHISEQMNVIKETLIQNGINFRLWLEEYLLAAENNGMRPPANFEDYLPWNMSHEMKERLSKDSIFKRGNVTFLERADGTIYHLFPDGTKQKIDIDSMTAEEFDKLISA